ncbi:hypothetical protein BJX64DRAFT_278438 [Aspergillus heterothallicus]
MDPEIQDIVTRFRQLKTSPARHIAIHQIINELSPFEWRDVKARINERSFQKDILGAVPLEISVQIAQYISLAELHLLRRVSRRWHDILSSKATCGFLYRLYTRMNISCPDNILPSRFTHYSKHRTRLERGDPHHQSRVALPSMTDNEVYTLTYSAGRYAWMTDDDTTIVVHRLTTGMRQRFCTKNRDRLYMIRLSESTVAAITMHGYCHVWSTLTDEMYSVRLPNTDVGLFVLSGLRVGFSFEAHTNNSDDGFIMHYDLQSGAGHTISQVQAHALVCIALESGDGLTAICLEPARCGRTASGEFHQLCITTYRLHVAGNTSVGRTRTFRLPLPGDWAVFVGQDLQAGCRNHMGILHARSPYHEEAVNLIVPVTYDSQTGSICVHTLQEQLISSPPCMVSVDKDILYYIANDDGKQSIRISNPFAIIPHYASKSMDLGLPRDPSDRVFLFDHGHRVLIGDSQSVSMVDATSTRVWTF